jgi:hypothetical protein
MRISMAPSLVMIAAVPALAIAAAVTASTALRPRPRGSRS